jgi:CDP-2,3-bis-(O-geranylgeranyl)-sn-glycerol synthase
MAALFVCPDCIADALVLLIAANGAPVIARKLLGRRFAQPLDGGTILADRRPLFGESKTWRGLATAVASSSAIAPLLGLSAPLGALFGLLTMGGDLLASFTKRRLGYAASSRARLLDAPPEALLPLLALHSTLGLGAWDVLAAAGGFVLLDALFSPLLFRLHIRNRPY